MIFLVVIAGCVFVGMAIRDGAIGKAVCHVSFEEARGTFVSHATLPHNGTDYCVHSSVRGTVAHVTIEESKVAHWLQLHGATTSDLPFGWAVSGIGDCEGWFVSVGWKAQFQHGPMIVTVAYDREKNVAEVRCQGADPR